MIRRALGVLLCAYTVGLVQSQTTDQQEIAFTSFKDTVLPVLLGNYQDQALYGQSLMSDSEVSATPLAPFSNIVSLISRIEQTLSLFKKIVSLGRHPVVYPREGEYLQTQPWLLDPRTCSQECIGRCLNPEKNDFTRLYVAFKYCIVPECQCSNSFEEEKTPEYQKLESIIRRWDVNSYGSDSDLYTSEGLRVFQFSHTPTLSLLHRDFDNDQKTWLETWHQETPEVLIQEELAFLVPVLDKLKLYQWKEPEAAYSLESCDLNCAGDCLALITQFQTENFGQRQALKNIVDTCSSQRCGCYFSEVEKEPCNRDCKMSCIEGDKPISLMDQCMKEQCLCVENKLEEEIVDEEMQEMLEAVQKRIQDDLDMQAEIVVYSALPEQVSEPIELSISIPEVAENSIVQTSIVPPKDLDENFVDSLTVLKLQESDSTTDFQSQDTETHKKVGALFYSEGEIGLPLKHIPRDLEIPIKTILILSSLLTFFMGVLFWLILKAESSRKQVEPTSLRKRIKIAVDEENRYAGKLSLLEKVEREMFVEKKY